MTFALRDYQIETIFGIKQAFNRGYSRPLNILFTGAGKTEIFIAYTMREVDITKERVLINAPAHLVWQMYFRFLRRHPNLEQYTTVDKVNSVPSIGVVLADTDMNSARIICSSTDTTIDRVPTDLEPLKLEDIFINDKGGVEKSKNSKRSVIVSERIDSILKHGLVTYIMNDEAHHSVAPSILLLHNRLFELYDLIEKPRPKVIGFTATGMREDGIGLDNLYDCISIQKPVNWGISNGYLAPLKDPINIHPQIEGRNVKLFELEDWEEIIFKAWMDNGEDRQTLGYLPTVEASIAITKYFNERGIKSVHIDGNGCIDGEGSHPKAAREHFFSLFEKGDIRIIFNWGVIVEGLDLPAASCIIWARETENITVFTQALGRILRLFDGNSTLPAKENALVLNATRNDLFMLTVGTLSGISVDRNNIDIVFDEDDEEEMELNLPEISIEDIRDAKLSDNVIYSIGRIINKSGSDWFHSDDDVLTLSVSKLDTLVILPPYFTLAKRFELILEGLSKQLMEGGFTEDLRNSYELAEKAYRLFSNYTLWHVKEGKLQGTWVYEDSSLALIMDYAIPYAHEKAEQVIKSFITKTRSKRSWKSEEVLMNDKQAMLLASFIGADKVNRNMTMLNASQLISYHMAFTRVVKPYVSKFFGELKGKLL